MKRYETEEVWRDAEAENILMLAVGKGDGVGWWVEIQP
jgi:hypothetical protein